MCFFLFGSVYTGKFKRPRLAEAWGRCICLCGEGPWQGASPSVSQAYRGVRRGPRPGPGAWGRVGYAALPETVVILRISWSYQKKLPFCQFKLKRQPKQTNSRPRCGARYPHHSGKYPVQQGFIICSSPYTALVMAQCRHWPRYMGVWARIFPDRLTFFVAVSRAFKGTRRGVGHPLFS